MTDTDYGDLIEELSSIDDPEERVVRIKEALDDLGDIEELLDMLQEAEDEIAGV